MAIRREEVEVIVTTPLVRVAVALFGCAAVVLAVLAWRADPQSPADWAAPLERLEAALSQDDLREAQAAWADAYRAAMWARDPDGMLATGRAWIRIGEASREGLAAVPEARRLFLAAFAQSRERGDADGVARAAEAFARLGDREIAERAFALAMSLAGRSADPDARERVAAVMVRAGQPGRVP